MPQSPIIDFLMEARVISAETAELFDEPCRDADIRVYRDTQSGVIYLDPAFSGKNLNYYDTKYTAGSALPRNEMDVLDTDRRSAILTPLISGKVWLDFGCGPGYQLRRNSTLCSKHLGIELNAMDRESLSRDGFSVSPHLNDTGPLQPDVISMFHVIEHLPDAVDILQKLHQLSPAHTKLVIEVPHARDWLIQHGPTEFRHFTFWSEHLVLHTRQSLQLLLARSGWAVMQEIAVQRYPVWNHLHWLSQKRPSGFNASISDPAALELKRSYESYLAARDQTDTLVILAQKKT